MDPHERALAEAEADATLRLEELGRSPAALAIAQRYVDGQITAEEMAELTISLYRAESDGLAFGS
ncbi:antitoxin VbhA family protein [Catelliglobosispora koreensis]|uniref:antitoxin VbhA family protein n=1 Tax=Catelliglobosispora koreensis TaxID=129052 RepID=UPI00035CA78B|nr:antitoxin VbhA family protein [Catelliglobosispora koreensis]